MSALRTVEEQLSEVLAAVRPLGTQTLAVPDALGATLRADVHAAVDIPVFANSAMDGFAVRGADVEGATAAHPVHLRVVADLPAGTDADPALGPGEAARIMTGAPVPTAADTVVPFEATAGGLADSLVTVVVQQAPAATGAHVRRAGDDVRTGEVIIETGSLLGPFQVSAAAAAGVAEVVVSHRPRVAVISTGSELVPAGSPLRRGQIPESNSVLLAGMVVAAGAEVVARLSVDDEGHALRDALARVAADAAPPDVVVFSGGVSAGAFEVVRIELAGTMSFTKVAMQPGKPQGFGVLPGGTLLFGLPGNPVSAAVSFEVFVRPALLALQGRAQLHRPTLRVAAGTGWRTPPGRRQYLPAVVETGPGGLTVRPATGGGSGSHLAGGLARAHALAVVPAETDAVAAGDDVDVMLLEGWGA
ncbi:molybdopterin molybdotransferase MoeA [Microbacterium sp. W1N]|uniref:molybdopterin molybdotransferase MoeA n=1 Tax=Microbacterium festucae TaxID=2977531 RepID=UPI0021C177A8|nr:gephyrin-like molybdotransferase Glp [Microbacterium festucae]MCT9820897.1 molybdopterin molybdotransferase MoeA [Microbacterium festucae]